MFGTGFVSCVLLANVTLSALFGDHAIVQKGPATRIWGTGARTEKVEVTLGTARAAAVTGTNGYWVASLDLTALGEGPYELHVRGPHNEIVTRDILVGEVWLAGGQSNMELVFVSPLFGTVFGAEKLWAKSAGRPLRFYNKMRQTHCLIRGDGDEKDCWMLPKPENLAKCSAVAFSFIEKVQESIGGPVGFVDTSVGGTRMAQWTAPECLADTDYWRAHWTNQVEQLGRQTYAAQWKNRYIPRVRTYDHDKLVREAPWKHGASLPTELPRGVSYYRRVLPLPKDFMTKNVNATTSFAFKGLRTAYASVTWCRYDRCWVHQDTMLKPDVPVSQHDRTMSMTQTLCGDDKVEVLLRFDAILPGARVIYEKPRIDNSSNAAQILLPQDGWDVFTEATFPPLPAGVEAPKPYRIPSMLIGHFYRGTLYPLHNLTFRGAIWYQGCAECAFKDPVHEVAPWFKVMVDNWRTTFDNGNFPFYWCQIAAFYGQPRRPDEASGLAAVREGQRRSRHVIDNGEMAVIFETGEVECHGRDKIPAGQRLARIALARDYGKKDVVYRSADYVKKEIRGGDVLLTFETYGSPLAAQPVKKEFSCSCSHPPYPVVRRSPDSQLEGFTLLDAKGTWHWADARIVDGRTVCVRAKGVTDPVDVRYNWGNNAAGNLWNADGLPVSTFTTEK